MSLACRVIGQTNSANANTVLHRYNLSSSDSVYNTLVHQYLRDVKNGYTDISADANVVVSKLGSLFLDSHGVSKRLTCNKGRVDPVEACTAVERYLAEHKEMQLMSNEEYERVCGHVTQLKQMVRNRIGEERDSELERTSRKIEEGERRISQHVAALMKFGYFREFLVSSQSSIEQNVEVVGRKSQGGLEKALEELVSCVISLSIQHGITVPQPDLQTMQNFIGRINWCKECIAKLVQGLASTPSSSVDGRRESPIMQPSVKSENGGGVGKEAQNSLETKPKGSGGKIDDLRTALNDLQFAHVYLARQYEDERSRYNKSLNQLRLKLSQSQELLAGSNEQLTNQTQQSLKIETKLSETLSELGECKKKLHEKSMEISILRTDHLGETSEPDRLSDGQTRLVESGDELDLQKSPRSQASDSGSFNSNAVSAPILRMEFKKIVKQMNEDFEKEIEKERTERRRLENLVKLYEQDGQKH